MDVYKDDVYTAHMQQFLARVELTLAGAIYRQDINFRCFTKLEDSDKLWVRLIDRLGNTKDFRLQISSGYGMRVAVIGLTDENLANPAELGFVLGNLTAIAKRLLKLAA